MNWKETIQAIERSVKDKFSGEATGHDWHHIDRVRRNALIIAEKEGGDLIITELAALLHDIDDHKFNGGDWEAGTRKAKQILEEHHVPEQASIHICQIIGKVSFKGANVLSVPDSIEGKSVQDADRLDAIGAIGIARAFAYGGNKNRMIYDPDEEVVLHQSREAYFNAGSHTINHFYEKLLLLKDTMNTPTGKQMAASRHAFMEQFLKQFYDEWDTK